MATRRCYCTDRSDCTCGMTLEEHRLWFSRKYNRPPCVADPTHLVDSFVHNHECPAGPQRPVVSVVGHGTPSWVRKVLGFNPKIADYREAMGIDWMNRDELSQAIPPAYTQRVGFQLIEALEASNA